jgi:hypothetical protein
MNEETANFVLKLSVQLTNTLRALEKQNRIAKSKN